MYECRNTYPRRQEIICVQQGALALKKRPGKRACRKNHKKPMWTNVSQYSGISPSDEEVGHQSQRCLISVIS
jgi:hypothetical protein